MKSNFSRASAAKASFPVITRAIRTIDWAGWAFFTSFGGVGGVDSDDVTRRLNTSDQWLRSIYDTGRP